MPLESVKDRAEEFAHAATAKAQDAWESTQQAASAMAARAEDGWDRMVACMSRNPFATFITGVGLGFALAAILRELAPPTNLLSRSRSYPPNIGP